MKFYFDEKTECIFCEPDTADEYLEHIWAIGCDYDGCHSVKDLMGLIDELVEYASKARECLRDGKIFPDEDRINGSRAAAIKEKELYLKKKGDN